MTFAFTTDSLGSVQNTPSQAGGSDVDIWCCSLLLACGHASPASQTTGLDFGGGVLPDPHDSHGASEVGAGSEAFPGGRRCFDHFLAGIPQAGTALRGNHVLVGAYVLACE